MPTHALDLASGTSIEQQLRGLLEGVDVVFHLAGIAHQHARASDYHALNHVATLRLARLAAEAGVGRFVFLSSVKAMGPASGAAERSESDCTEPPDAYGLSKWLAERDLRAEFENNAMAVFILRPALVYGGEAKGNLALLARAVRAGMPRPPRAGGRSMVALADLVDLLCVLVDQAATGVQTWIVTDGEVYSTRFIYDQMRQASGRGRGVAWLPDPVWRLAAAVLDRLRPGEGGSTFDKLFGSERYSNAALLAATGWRPRQTLQDVIAQIMLPRKPAP